MRQHGQDTGALWVLSLGISTLLSVDTRKPLSFSRHSLGIFVPDTAPRHSRTSSWNRCRCLYDFSHGLWLFSRTKLLWLFYSTNSYKNSYSHVIWLLLMRFTSIYAAFPSLSSVACLRAVLFFPVSTYIPSHCTHCTVFSCSFAAHCSFAHDNVCFCLWIFSFQCLCCACACAVLVSVCLCCVLYVRKVQNNKLFLLLFVFIQKCWV